MITLLKKYWLKTLVSIVVVILTSVLSSWATKIIYKKQIKVLDANISEAWEKIGDSKVREERLANQANENYMLAMEKEAKLRRKDREMIVKIHEKRELKKQIKEMPASIVVVQTIEILNCDDIKEQQQGIVFSLSCAKTNLETLVDSFYLKHKIADWTEKFYISQSEVTDLKNVITAKNEAYAERGTQLTSAYGVIDEWEGKFNLSEQRGKSNWWKGLKTGGIIGGVIDRSIVFGHDEPTYQASIVDLNKRCWIHCKNLEALKYFGGIEMNETNAFWHENDDFTLTNKKYIWTNIGKELTTRSIMVMPEVSDETLQNTIDVNCAGICSDWIHKIKVMRT